MAAVCGSARTGPLIALSPHIDDLAFSLGAALCDGRLAGSRVVTIFSRSAYTPEQPHGEASRTTALRMAEDRRFFAHAPVAELRWLGLLDAPLRRLGVSNVFAAPAEAGDIAAVRRALEPLLSPSACLLVPMALGGHLDHRVVREVACAVHAEGRCRLVFYEDLPYAGFMPLEAVGEAVFLLEERLRARLHPVDWPSHALAEAKQWAVTSYASQVEGHLLATLLAHGQRRGRRGVPAERVWCLS